MMGENLGGLRAVLQAVVCDGGPLDVVSFGGNRFGSSKRDAGRCEVVDALVTADVAIMLDEGVDLLLQLSGQAVVAGQNAVRDRLLYCSGSTGLDAPC